jgi:hypothetical protein
MNNATRPTEGFLSSEISRSVSKIHDRFPQWFKAANSINELGMRILPLLQPVKTNDQQLLVAALYGRALTSFQSAYILAERGLTADARTVVRAAVETTVVLNAVVRDPSVSDLLVLRHQWHNRKLLKSWIDDPQAVAAMSAAQLTEFKAAIASIDFTHPCVKDRGDPLIIASLALKTGLLWLYNAVYRPTSGDSAHTSLQTLERHVQADEASEIQGLRFGPDVANVCDTLSAAISTLLPAIKASITLFHVPQFGPELDACTEAWKSLGIPPKNSVNANS